MRVCKFYKPRMSYLLRFELLFVRRVRNGPIFGVADVFRRDLEAIARGIVAAIHQQKQRSNFAEIVVDFAAEQQGNLHRAEEAGSDIEDGRSWILSRKPGDFFTPVEFTELETRA